MTHLNNKNQSNHTFTIIYVLINIKCLFCDRSHIIIKGIIFLIFYKNEAT